LVIREKDGYSRYVWRPTTGTASSRQRGLTAVSQNAKGGGPYILSTGYDGDADALYITVRPGAQVAYTESLDDWTLIDVDSRGSVIGIEVIHPARVWPVVDLVDRYRIEGPNRDLLLQMVPAGMSGGRVPFASPDLDVDSTASNVAVL